MDEEKRDDEKQRGEHADLAQQGHVECGRVRTWSIDSSDASKNFYQLSKRKAPKRCIATVVRPTEYVKSSGRGN